MTPAEHSLLISCGIVHQQNLRVINTDALYNKLAYNYDN
jgi:hypothetical protein